MDELMYYSYLYGYKTYDWVDPSRTRTPDDYPYNFDSYYVWRENIKGAHCQYGDRMWQQDTQKAKEAFGKLGQRGNYTKQQCKDIIEKYYDGKYICVGFAISCNQSSGYEIPIFFIKPKAKAMVDKPLESV